MTARGSPSAALPRAPGPAAPAAQLRRLGLRARKSLSQSFLADRAIAGAIVAAADLDPARDDVLEVGPGLGILTERLVAHARRVVAVELDPHLADWLRQTIAAPNLDVRHADILRFDPATAFDAPFVVVANLPYHITSPALRHLLASGPPAAHRIVVMVQQEVAERVTARPGDLSALAVILQAQAHIRLIRRVPSGAFHPRPKVGSAVLLLEPLPDEERLVPRAAQSAFEQLVHAGFAQPRKTLANSLAQGLGASRVAVVPLLRTAGIDPGRRAQELDLDEWARLFQAHATLR